MAPAPSRDNTLSFHEKNLSIGVKVDNLSVFHTDSIEKLSRARRRTLRYGHIQNTVPRENLSDCDHLKRDISLILINNFHFFTLLYFVLIVYTKISKKSNYNFGERPKT